MSPQARLAFLVETVELEARNLLETDRRLFAVPFSADRAMALRTRLDESERTDAFVARFGRLQDTLADKLLPEYLRSLDEPVGAVIDNLDRAEKLGLLSSADEWLASRKLRNRMVREYVRDPAELSQTLNQGHVLVPLLTSLAAAIAADCRRRGLLGV